MMRRQGRQRASAEGRHRGAEQVMMMTWWMECTQGLVALGLSKKRGRETGMFDGGEWAGPKKEGEGVELQALGPDACRRGGRADFD